MHQPKFWIGVACKEHVANGVELGVCQFCHGKSNPLKRLKPGDYVVYYSSKVTIDGTEPYQKFTALGKVTDDEVYQVAMESGFKPFRRRLDYLDVKHVAIRPLIDSLAFIKNKKAWGYAFRYGFFEIDEHSFSTIATEMLGYNPLR